MQQESDPSPLRPRLALHNVFLPDGARADVTLEGRRIIDIRLHANAAVVDARVSPRDVTPTSRSYIKVIDLTDYLLLPSLVEPHSHLDKSLLLSRAPNLDGGLAGAVQALQSVYSTMSQDDIASRALAAVAEGISHGMTAIRTHADCGQDIGLRAVEVLVDVKEQLRDFVDIQVAVMTRGVTGEGGDENFALLERALTAGADLIGGAPWREVDPAAALSRLFELARSNGRGLDLHLDETTQKSSLILEDVLQYICDTGFDLPVTAAHCISLATQDPATIDRICRLTADLGVSIVTLPQSNLYLQGREGTAMKMRGMTAVDALAAAGVNVAGGGDNWRDPFNPMGRIDPLETASLLVSAAHLNIEDAYDYVSRNSRAAMGLPPVSMTVGSPADLLAIKADSLADALAGASEDRVVIKDGRVLSRTSVERKLDVSLRGALTTSWGAHRSSPASSV